MGYKKYIKDYRKEYIVKPNGKPGVTATYVGKYYDFAADEESFKRSRLIYACLSLLALACCVAPLFFNTDASHTVYVSVPCVITLFPAVHLVLGVFNLFVKKTPLIREFRDKSEGRITTNSAVSFCFILVTAVCWTVKCALSAFGVLDLVSIALFLVAGGAAGYMYLSRKAFATVELDNPNADDE